MGLRVYFIVFTFILTSFNLLQAEDTQYSSRSIESGGDLKEAYKLVRRAYKEQRKQIKAQEKEKSRLVQLEVCVACDQINPVINDINIILRKMVDENHVDTTKIGDIEQIEKLEAMYIISQRDTSDKSVVVLDDGCDFYPKEVYLRNPFGVRIDESQLTEIFSFNIPMEKIVSMHIRDNKEKSRTYYYRAAKPNEDTIIRVHVPKEGEPTVQYMHHGDPAALRRKVDKEIRRRELAREAALRNKNAKSNGNGNWGGLWESKSETTDWKFGLEVERDGNLPKHITILKGSDSTEIFNDVYVRTNAELSDRKQGLNLGLGDHRTDYLRFNMKADGRYSASVPFQIETDVISLDNAELEYTDEENRIAAGLRMGDTHIFNLTGVQNREEGTESYGVSRSFTDPYGGSISIEFKDEHMNTTREQTVWIRYSLDF